MNTTIALTNGSDRLFIHGATIADPYNDPAVTWDAGRPVFVIEVEAAEGDLPFLNALDEHGLTVVGTNLSGDWIVEQARPLQSARGPSGHRRAFAHSLGDGNARSQRGPRSPATGSCSRRRRT